MPQDLDMRKKSLSEELSQPDQQAGSPFPLDSNHIEITPSGSHDKLDFTTPKSNFTPKTKKILRFGIFLAGIAFLLIGRLNVPDNDVPTVQDKVLDALKFANDFINTAGHEAYRDAFQALCSFLVDVVFMITFIYWVFRGNSCRLPLTLAAFYITRAIVQKLWFSPYPPGFYWDSPGIPSLVVPYGRGSDFFFSGHSGFLIICAKEWHRIGKRYVRNFVLFVAAYTILTLLTYRIHYFIDVFTGVFFAEYCWIKMDLIRGRVDSLVAKTLEKISSLFVKKQPKHKVSSEVIEV